MYLHIDHTAHAYAKVLMDGIFGRGNFRNEIVWHYNTGGASKRHFSRKHETLLYYAKSRSFVFNAQREEYREEKTDHFTEIDDAGRAYRIRSIGGKDYKYYKDEGRFCHDVWDIDAINAFANERTGYPTQKPLTLYERIIKASSNEGDMVLDPFCGCATTPVTAERLGRQWIGMDLWAGAHQIVVSRLRQEKQIWRPEAVKLVTVPPERTDAAEMAAPHLPQIERGLERRSIFSRDEMKAILITRWGGCAGGVASSRPMATTGSLTLTITFPSRRVAGTTWTTGLSCAAPVTAGKVIPLPLRACGGSTNGMATGTAVPPLTSAYR